MSMLLKTTTLAEARTTAFRKGKLLFVRNSDDLCLNSKSSRFIPVNKQLEVVITPYAGVQPSRGDCTPFLDYKYRRAPQPVRLGFATSFARGYATYQISPAFDYNIRRLCLKDSQVDATSCMRFFSTLCWVTTEQTVESLYKRRGLRGLYGVLDLATSFKLSLVLRHNKSDRPFTRIRSEAAFLPDVARRLLMDTLISCDEDLIKKNDCIRLTYQAEEVVRDLRKRLKKEFSAKKEADATP